MTDESILMLTPIREKAHIPGAVQITAECGHEAWIAPSGVQLLLGGGVHTRCQDCVDPAEVTDLRIAPGQMRELTELLGFDAADDLVQTAMADPPNVVRTLQKHSRRKARR